MKYKWEDCTIGFECPNCGEDLIADSQNGTMTCECGLTYRLDATLVLSSPEPVPPAPVDAGDGKE